MKKYLVPLTLVSVLALTACGGGGDTEPASADSSTEESQAVEETRAVTDEQADEWAKSVIGFGPDTSWQEAAAQGAPSWARAVNSVTYGKGGNIVFTMQLDRTSDKDIAESVTTLYANSMRMTPPDFADEVSYIIVENGAGEHMKQERI